ncbi:MAG: radical SAM protein [Bacteroidales bacterium]|nr:radical SAM protein [Bacteroidales bacterium]
MDKYLLLNSPMFVNWNYTYKCNFDCNHCYSRNRINLEELSFQQKITVAKNLIRNKVFSVNLGGGEPLLCDDCYEIIKLLRENNVRVNVSTNGWKISDECIIRLKDAGLSGISISLDSICPEKHDALRNKKGSFEEACFTMQRFARTGIFVYVSTVITQDNFSELEAIIEHCGRLGVNGVDLKRLKTMGKASDMKEKDLTADQLRLLYQQIPIWKKKHPLAINLVYGARRILGLDAGCPCGKTALAIMCNGDISPCVYNIRVIGNALVDDIHDVWVNSKELNYLRTHFECMGLSNKE